MQRFLIRILLNSLAILVVTRVIPGIYVDDWGTLLVAGLVLGLINSLIRPILVVLTFPLTLLTLGLFLLVLNAICLHLTAWLVQGFHVAGFWSALFGSLLITLISGALSWFVTDTVHTPPPSTPPHIDPNKVIDHQR